MKIDGHKTAKEVEDPLNDVVEFLKPMRNRLIWNSVLGILNLFVICGTVVLYVLHYI